MRASGQLSGLGAATTPSAAPPRRPRHRVTSGCTLAAPLSHHQAHFYCRVPRPGHVDFGLPLRTYRAH
ncbi:hypothetical protein E2C01_090112 [Portunus trituberculatus]|uniref:Uncharacterized protein n=1 Tax=Portunus trituberculatus TaxID=210409 RepID=A0A5B7JAL4_PORTR|nr:hypothetical protein [Portunus trituberculatus]